MKLKLSKDKREILLILIFLILVVSGIILNNPINKNDEVTLLGETIKMYNGYHIYKDINVLITPLFLYIGLSIFKAFGANLFIFRVYGIIIYVFLLLNIYILLKKLKISRNVAYISLVAIIIFLQDIMKVGANYNILAIAISILGINYIISMKEKNSKYYLLQGVIVLLIFMSKQNIGVYYFVAFAICEFIENYNVKTKLKNLCITSLPVIIGVLLYCGYLYFDNALYNFIDYTFLGMKDFKLNTIVESYIPIFALFNIIPVLVMYINKRLLDKNQKILFIFSIIMLLIIYPIVCGVHSKMSLIYSMLSFIYLINSKKKSYKIVENICLIIMLLYICIQTVLNISNWLQNHINKVEDPYYGAVYSENIEKFISYIDEYIMNSNKKVVIVSPDAALFNIRLNINNGILDLPVKGNVGINGKDKIINEIQNTENAKFIIMKYLYYQEYPEVHEYIRNNYRKVDEFGRFEVYE